METSRNYCSVAGTDVYFIGLHRSVLIALATDHRLCVFSRQRTGHKWTKVKCSVAGFIYNYLSQLPAHVAIHVSDCLLLVSILN